MRIKRCFEKGDQLGAVQLMELVVLMRLRLQTQPTVELPRLIATRSKEFLDFVLSKFSYRYSKV